MLTSRLTPIASAASSTLRVPTTFVFHAFGRVELEQRQVLERGGVEHDLGPVLLEHLEDPVAVADVGEHERG